MNNKFRYENGKIFSRLTGDQIAVWQDGKLRMMPGRNALTPKVREFLQSVEVSSSAEAVPEIAPEAVPEIAPEEVPEIAPEEVPEQDFKGNVLFFGGPPSRGGTGVPDILPEKSTVKSEAALSVWDIPDSLLPAFSPELGVSTPAFKNFVLKHNLSNEQTAELVRRLERKL